MDFFASPEASLGAAIAALVLVLGFRFARPASWYEWLAFAGYAGAITVTFLASRGVVPGPAAEAGFALRLFGAAVLVVGLVVAGSAVRARRPSADALPSSGPFRLQNAWLGLALVLVGFLARTPSLAGGVTVLLAVVLASWAALRNGLGARPRR